MICPTDMKPHNGICFKLSGNDWQECRLEGEEDYFTEAYLSLPYEIDANTFAYKRVKEIYGDMPKLCSVYQARMPKVKWEYEEYRKLFRRIDAELCKERN